MADKMAMCHPDRKDSGNGLCSSCYMKMWREKNRKHHLAYKKKYREEHQEEIHQYNLEYYQKNREKSIANATEWKRQHRERANQWCKEWNSKNPDKVRATHHAKIAKRMNAEGTYTHQEWIDLCNYWENLCLCCGKRKKLTVDHVIPLSRGGTNYISNIQPLCHSCNSKKSTKHIDYRLDWT